MPKLPKRRAYLVSVTQKREAVRVYAVMATTPDEALEAVALNIPPKALVEIVGGLSRDLVKRMAATAAAQTLLGVLQSIPSAAGGAIAAANGTGAAAGALRARTARSFSDGVTPGAGAE